jgi:hypothetical protein
MIHDPKNRCSSPYTPAAACEAVEPSVSTALVVTEADLPGTSTINLVAACIVRLSVLLHGLTSYPGSQAYATWYESHDDPAKLAEGRAVHHHRISPDARHAIDKRMER